jgi:hypothetical protein
VLAPPAPCFTGLSLPPPPKTLHRERVVTGKIFQALPTQTDRRTDIVTLIYRIANGKFSKVKNFWANILTTKSKWLVNIFLSIIFHKPHI